MNEPYDKIVWLRMSMEAHEVLDANLDKLSLYIGAIKLELNRVTELPGDKSSSNKRNRSGQGQVRAVTQEGGDAGRVNNDGGERMDDEAGTDARNKQAQGRQTQGQGGADAAESESE